MSYPWYMTNLLKMRTGMGFQMTPADRHGPVRVTAWLGRQGQSGVSRSGPGAAAPADSEPGSDTVTPGPARLGHRDGPTWQA